jgi:hypothetical protein
VRAMPRSGRCRTIRRLRSAGAILALGLSALIGTGCGGSAASSAGPANQHRDSTSTGPLHQRIADLARRRQLRPGQACAVTHASSHPRVPPAMLRLINGDPSSAYGRGPLWVLFPYGGNNASRVHGQVYVKVGWYVGLAGPLRGAARRIDGRLTRSGRLQVSDPDTAARRMDASALLLPTPGCWQVTGEIAGHSLTWIFRAHVGPPPR